MAQTTTSGLTHAEAERRLAEHGPNSLPSVPPVPMWRRFVRQFQSPLIYVLLFALVFDLITWAWEGAGGWPVESLVIALILLLNSGLGTLQERRSEQALARLSSLTAPLAWVLRDGGLEHIPSAAIVPGDVVRIEAGDRVPADGQLIEEHGCSIDESVLTGESAPVGKHVGDGAMSGTLTVRGRALLEVAATGAASSMGRMATMLGGIETARTPLERRLDGLGRQIARWIGLLSAALIIGGVLVEGTSHLDAIILFAVALAVAAVPEGMPAVVTLTLALGVQRMARRHAVVRRLSAVEALGSVTVIATDKTGTLTENRMTVGEVDLVDSSEACIAMAIANDADLAAAVGDPLELALLAHARDAGVDPHQLRATMATVSGRPFDSEWKFMRVTVEVDGSRRGYLKGASEVIIERSVLSDEDRSRWSRRVEELAGRGFRVLALASGDGDQETGLRFLGLVALWDPPRAEVPDAIRVVQAAGVRVLMITGDHPTTASAVARAIGIGGDAGTTMTGAQVAQLDAAQLRAAVATTSVFARVSPEQKLAIVEALSDAGEIVAVTGDGVNDAPALKRSDVGVAMGQRGSDVAREVADLVLLDDNFASIVAAIEEGRGIYANIQKFIRFLFSTNVALVLLVVAGAIGAVALDLRDASGALLLPLTAIQLLWINFLADGPPALALGLDRNAGVMERPPQPPNSALLDRASLRFIVVTGSLKATVGAALLIAFPWAGYSVIATRTAVFIYESIAQLWFAYPSRRIGVVSLSNPALHLAVGLGTVVQVLTISIPGLRTMLGLVALDASALVAVAVSIVLTVGLAEATNRWLGTVD